MRITLITIVFATILLSLLFDNQCYVTTIQNPNTHSVSVFYLFTNETLSYLIDYDKWVFRALVAVVPFLVVFGCVDIFILRRGQELEQVGFFWLVIAGFVLLFLSNVVIWVFFGGWGFKAPWVVTAVIMTPFFVLGILDECRLAGFNTRLMKKR